MRPHLLVAVLLVPGLLTACASGGGSSAPQLTPTEWDLMYARFSGAWVVSADLSDPGSVALETEASPERGDRLGARPESTSLAIRPTYRRAGEARAAISGQMDRTAMRQVILVAGARPSSLELRLDAAGLRFQIDDREPWMLPMDGSWIEVQEQLVLARVRLVWEAGLPIVEREIRGGGVIREVLEGAPNGGTLWLTRQVLAGGTDAWQPAQFTYGRP